MRGRLLDVHAGVAALKALGFRLQSADAEFYEWAPGDGVVEPAAATAAIAAHRLRTSARRARALATRASKLGHLAATTRATALGALAILALGPAAEPNFAPRPLASTIDVVASVAVASLAIEAKDATRWSEAATEPDWEAPDPFFYHLGFPHVPKSVRR